MPSNYSSSYCQHCPYCKTKHLSGSIQRLPLNAEVRGKSILLVFQAPGENEWTGNGGKNNPAPIISNNYRSAAARLRNSFKRIQKTRMDYDITEVVQCYPGKNANKRDRRPNAIAISQCSNHLAADIQNHAYSKIISFGVIANQAVDDIIRKRNISVTHIKLPHPSSGKLSNSVLDSNLK